MATEKPEAEKTAQIRNELDEDVLVTAEDAGVDVDAILAETAAEYEKYSPSTQARFAKASIDAAVETASAEIVNGLLLGSRDRYGKNWPRRYSIVRSNGQHLEASSFQARLPGPNGGNVKLESPSVIGLACSFNEQYEDWSAERVDSISPITNEDLAERLASVAMEPSTLGRTDEYEIVAVRGEIAFINPQTVFVDGQPDGNGPVMIDDDRDELNLVPHFEIALRDDEGTRVRAHLERQRFGEPFLALPDLDLLLDDAMDFEDPEDQASLLQSAYEGLEVVVVGNVSKFDTSRNDGRTTNWVDIAATSVVSLEDTPSRENAADSHETLDAFERSDESDEETADDDPDEEDREDTLDEDRAENGSSDDEEDDTVDAEVEAVVEKVNMFAELQGVSASELTVADVEEKAPGIDADADTISFALRLLSSNDEEEDVDAEEIDEEIEEEVEEESEEDDESYVCGAETARGGECSVSVSAPGERCHHHTDAEEEDVDAEEDDESDEETADEDPSPDGDGEVSHDASDVGSAVAALSGIKENGMIRCPEDGCMFESGSSAVVVGHIARDHEVGDSVSEWIGERA